MLSSLQARMHTHTHTHKKLWEEREDRIRDRRWRVSFASARSRRGLPTGSSSAGCGVWCVGVGGVLLRLLLRRLLDDAFFFVPLLLLLRGIIIIIIIVIFSGSLMVVVFLLEWNA